MGTVQAGRYVTPEGSMQMRHARLFVSASMVSLLALVGGCGGGSGGGSTGGGGGGGNPPTTVTFSFRGPTPPAAVAAQIGSGAFAVQTVSSGTVTLSIPTGTKNFAVAYVCPSFDPGGGNVIRNDEYVFEASTDDGTAFSPAPCRHFSTPAQPGALTGSVDASAISGVAYTWLYAQNGSTFIESSVLPANFSLSAQTGTNRIGVLAYQATQFSNYGNLSLAAARTFSSQAVPGALNGGSPVVLGAADATAPQAITYSGVPSGFHPPSTAVLGNPGGGEFIVTSTATDTYPALPAAAMASGDFYHFLSTSQSGGQLVGTEMTTATGSPVTLTFPAPWTYAGPAAAKLPTFSFDYQGFAGKSGVIQTGIIAWNSGTTAQFTYQVSASAHYQNGSTTIAMPDVSGLSGFFAAPVSGTMVTWAAEITQQNVAPFQALAVNTTIVTVQDVGTYTMP
jgi:hypothetical protein